MRFGIRFLLILTIAMALLGWGLDVVPGRLANVLFIPFVLTILLVIAGGGLIAILGIPLGIVACLRHRYEIRDWFLREIRETDWRPKVDRSVLIQALAIPFVAVVFVMGITAQIPANVGFRVSRQAFEDTADSFGAIAPSAKSDSWNVVNSGARFGLYRVDKIGIDGRGGIYFRVNTGQDGIGPDRMSYGFVKSPNATGSPFGRSHYVVSRLVDDWYVFQASDDYY